MWKLPSPLHELVMAIPVWTLPIPFIVCAIWSMVHDARRLREKQEDDAKWAERRRNSPYEKW